jgi:alanine racemase
MINLYDLLDAANGQLFGEAAARIFTDVCYDPHEAGENKLFVAHKSDHGDTHRFIPEVVQAGIGGVICTHPPEFEYDKVTFIIVKDPDAAMSAWAKAAIAKYGIRLIGLAGPAGKSLTGTAIYHLLKERFNVHLSDVAGGQQGIIRALAGLKSETEIAVIEFGLERLGQMSTMLDAAEPEIVVLTGLAHAPAETRRFADEMFPEYALLLDRLSAQGLAVMNADDDNTPRLRLAAGGRLMTVGMEQYGADLLAYNVVASVAKTGFDLRFRGERYAGRWIPWLGRHQLYAALSALMVAAHIGVPMEEMLHSLSTLPYMPGRMRPLTGIHDALIIDDTGNSTPYSNLEALEWFRAVNENRQPGDRHRLIFVMGDMASGDGYHRAAHRLIGQRAADVADIIVTEGADASMAARAALDAGKPAGAVRATYSPPDVLVALTKQYRVKAGDTVLVTGGVSARMEQVVRQLLKHEHDQERLARQGALYDTMRVTDLLRPSRVEINLEALAHNVRCLKEMVGPQVRLMAVVKSDAYGHGAVACARTALLNGAEHLAVSNIQEALELVEAGIDAPILVLNYTPVMAARHAVRQRIALTVYDLDLARAYDRAARELNTQLRVHIKVDTGMGRLGVLASETLTLFRHLSALRNLDIEGIYTHFASADEDPDFTAQQVKVFRDVIKPLRATGFQFKYTHAANSAGTLASAQNHFNLVRVGLAMYGLSPSEQVPVPPDFQPVMAWKTVVAQVKTLPAGHSVGYGRTWRAQEPTRVALLPVGYADGFRRALSNSGEVLVHGQRAPVIGRVSMEKTTINVTHIPNVSVGDEVVLLGEQGDDAISADEMAARWGTINYEVVTSILPRASRR